jgi:hypothetical protein
MPHQALRSITVTLTIACLLPSCGSGSKDKSGGSESAAPGVPKASIVTARISDLTKHASGAVTYKGELFSGRAIERFANGELAQEHYYHQGFLDGPVREFYEDGSKKSDTQHKQGVADGISFQWTTDGTMTHVLYKGGIETQGAIRDPAPASSGN